MPPPRKPAFNVDPPSLDEVEEAVVGMFPWACHRVMSAVVVQAQASQQRSERGRNYTGRKWSHGWGIDGHPYLDTSSQFLLLPSKKPPAAARAPAWAPSYPYPKALGRRVEDRPAPEECKPSARSLVDAVEASGSDAFVTLPCPSLPEDLLKSLDDLSAALGSLDAEGGVASSQRAHRGSSLGVAHFPDSMAGLVTALGQLRGFTSGEDKLMKSRARDLLDAYAGRQGPPPPCRSWKVRTVERQIVRRFKEACAKNPEDLRQFIETDLPDQLLTILQPYRLAREAAAVSAPTAEAGFPTLPPKKNLASNAGVNHEVHAVTARSIGAAQAKASAAALQLPWSSEECWERRWEQEPLIPLVTRHGHFQAIHDATQMLIAHL